MGRRVKIENRDAILRSAYKLFLHRGYDNVTILEIAAGATINPRIIYRHFEKKEEILGAVVESIKKKMVEYLNLPPEMQPISRYCVCSMMRYQYSVRNAEFFRLVSSLTKMPEASMKEAINTFALMYPTEKDWRYDKETRIKWFYILGGTLMLQYEFVTNFSGYSLSTENSDFMHNFEKKSISPQAMRDFGDYMRYAIIQNMFALEPENSETFEDELEKASEYLKNVDIDKFKEYYENELNYG